MKSKQFWTGLGVGLVVGAVVSGGVLKAQDAESSEVVYLKAMSDLQIAQINGDQDPDRTNKLKAAFKGVLDSKNPSELQWVVGNEVRASDSEINVLRAHRNLSAFEVLQNQRIIELLEDIKKQGAKNAGKK